MALTSGMARHGLRCWALAAHAVGSGRGCRLPTMLWFGEGAMGVIMTSAGRMELKGGKGNGFSVYQQNTEFALSFWHNF